MSKRRLICYTIALAVRFLVPMWDMGSTTTMLNRHQ